MNDIIFIDKDKIEYVDTTINIMGEEWKIIWSDDEEILEDNYGLTFGNINLIVISKIKDTADNLDWINNQKIVLRHELLHAYLNSCGLASSTNGCDSWADNEEMVDWFARLSTRIFNTYKELKII